MQRRSISYLALAAGLAAAVSIGCASSAEKNGNGDGAAGRTGEFSEGTLIEEMDIVEEGMEGPQRVPELETIYYDFDMALIRDDQKPTLRANANAIQGHGEWRRIIIEGHTDERGSEEYNLALGERRANAAKRYLVNLGVSGARVDTVSFGESNPAVQGHDEAAWRWNRRADFKVTR
jgi:peptidoglycan-associated lipoprotein